MTDLWADKPPPKKNTQKKKENHGGGGGAITPFPDKVIVHTCSYAHGM